MQLRLAPPGGGIRREGAIRGRRTAGQTAAGPLTEVTRRSCMWSPIVLDLGACRRSRPPTPELPRGLGVPSPSDGGQTTTPTVVLTGELLTKMRSKSGDQVIGNAAVFAEANTAESDD